MSDHTILFRTISGSRLYGLEHENSDYDYYTVIDKPKPGRPKYHTHKIIDHIDTQVVDFGTWLHDCEKGVPQALEAMFSQKADIDLIPEFRAGYRAGKDYSAYRGMMKTVANTSKWNDEKHKRLVIRLGIQVGQLRLNGRFNPTLNDGQVRGIFQAARLWTMDQCYDSAQRLAWRVD